MLADKKYNMRLCRALTLIAIFAVVTVFTNQAIISAASLKEATFVSGFVAVKKPLTVKPDVRAAKPNNTCNGGPVPNGCSVIFSGTLSGNLSVTIPSSNIVVSPLNGTAQLLPFTFETEVYDPGNFGDPGWTLQATSAGLRMNSASKGTNGEVSPFSFSTVSATCAMAHSCLNAGGVNVVSGGTVSLSSASTAVTYASTDNSTLDVGLTSINVHGYVAASADTLPGNYSGIITVTISWAPGL